MNRRITQSVSRRLLLGMALFPGVTTLASDAQPQTGPSTQRRFPPLVVPAGFKATLFACDPMIEYPSVIATGPRPGAVFVAIDYMTGLGTHITRRSEVRLIEDTDSDGYADKSTVFAGGFNSIMGLALVDGTLYVMHAPLLSALRDSKGTGIADVRMDLVTGLGLTPEENPVRLHCANGVTAGHDGWLYLALGDHGCNVRRPEGDRLIFEGGGILRCRPDGRDLHVFATGLRNIYDVALDAELNVFVRDNENDGGDYKIRVCHSFFGADHGYPYLYYEQPAQALRPLADLGLGSSAGGVFYLERHFPPEFWGDLFFCEWGKSLVRYRLDRAGSSFASPAEIEFATGGQGDPYGFKPTDVVVQRDGTLMVSDYADGQRPQRGRGRIYHIEYVGDARATPQSPVRPLARLDSESYLSRCEAQAAIEREAERGLKQLADALATGRIGRRGRQHAIWILVRLLGDAAIEPLFAIAKNDTDPSVRAQAVRAIADLADPVLTQHRLDAGPGDSHLAARLAALSNMTDRRLTLEIVIALGRLRWTGTADWLKEHLAKPDAALAHAAMQALRQSGNWPAILRLVDAPDSEPLRAIALRAASRQYDARLVDGLLERLAREKDAVRVRQYVECLAQVHKKPGPWIYWGYRPQPRPANKIAWERTSAIADAIKRMLSSPDMQFRLVVLKMMRRESIPVRLEDLSEWLGVERDPARLAALLEYLRDQRQAEMLPLLTPVIRSPLQATSNRLAALALAARLIGIEHARMLFELAQQLEDGVVLAETLRLLGKYPQRDATSLLAGKLDSNWPEVRAAAIEALGALGAAQGREALVRLLADADAQVRRAAAGVAGKLNDPRAIAALLTLVADADGQVRQAGLDALRQLKEPRAVPLAVRALGDSETELIALVTLRELGGPQHSGPVADLAKRNPSLEVLTTAVQTLTTWREHASTGGAQQRELDRAVAEIQGASGSLVRWTVRGKTSTADGATERPKGEARFATGTEGRIVIASKGADPGSTFHAETDIAVSESTDVELLGSGSGDFQVWLDGKPIYQRKKPTTFSIDSDRVAAALAKGNNRLAVSVTSASRESPVEFHLHFRRKSAVAEHERLLQAALARPGNPKRGRTVFLNSEKSLCLKCHRLGDAGERAGPELTGLGSRFSRIFIAESILQPSRTIAPSFGTAVVALANGKVVSGVKIADDETALTLVDNQGQKQTIAKPDIQEVAASALSTMPDGLEKRLGEDEFVDLVAFLASLKESEKP